MDRQPLKERMDQARVNLERKERKRMDLERFEERTGRNRQ
jgi:hypothetical protein